APASQLSGETQLCRGIEASLKTSDRVASVSAPPRFRLTLRNRTAQAVKVLDIRNGRRPDLENTYFSLEVLKDRRVLDLPHAICDPGPISDKDFFRIPAGAEESISLSEQCID